MPISRPTLRWASAGLLATFCSFLLAAPAPTGAEANGGGMLVSDAWARATTPGMRVGAMYFTLANHGHQADVLLSVASPAATHAELHRTVTDTGIARMRPAGAISVGPGQTLRATPGGLHVMLTELHQPLVAGVRMPLQLTFQKAGTLTVMVEIRSVTTGTGHADAGP